MSREIKFRGQRIYNGEWVYGYYVKGATRHCILHDLGGIQIDVIPESVGQFTGLKDKAGNDIYEGDIARILYTDWPSNTDGSISLADYKKSISHIGVVEFNRNESKWSLLMWSKKYQEYSYSSIHHGQHGEIEIIGNIHQNPELINS